PGPIRGRVGHALRRRCGLRDRAGHRAGVCGQGGDPVAGRGRALVHPGGGSTRGERGHCGRSVSRKPSVAAGSDRRAEGGMKGQRKGALLSRMMEGSAVALDSIQANKVRAALTILGVAIGVTVVIAMASAITGITNILEAAGPKTFFVYRYFSGGLNVSDGSDELSPWRRMPWLTVDEAELIRNLPAVRDVNIGEYTNGPVSFEGVELKSVAIAGMTPSWNLVNGGDILAGRNYTPMEYAA